MQHRKDLTASTLTAVRDHVAAVDLPLPRDLGGIIANGQARRARWRTAAVLSTAGALAATLAFVLPGRPALVAPRHAGPPVAGRGPVLELASYRFDLPRGFTPRDGACASLPPSSTAGGTGIAVHNGNVTDPETVVQYLRAAASADGGCLEVGIAAGVGVVPATATPIAVGGYQGFVVTAPGGDLTLYVTLACSTGCQAVIDESHYLVLASEGLTQQQLVSVATSGLPS